MFLGVRLEVGGSLAGIFDLLDTTPRELEKRHISSHRLFLLCCSAKLMPLATILRKLETIVIVSHLPASNPAVQDTGIDLDLRHSLRWCPLYRPLLLLIANPAVQAELKLNAGQKKALAAFQAEVVEPLRNWRELDWEERDRRHAFANEQTKKGLPKILDGPQLQRLHEIDVQQRGCRGILADEEIVTKLKLTAEQRRALREATERAEVKSQTLCDQLLYVNDVYKKPKYKAEMAEERRSLIQELAKLHADSYQRFQAGLTEEQQKLFRAILGKKFDIAALLAAID
jgi:hypothetical protein